MPLCVFCGNPLTCTCGRTPVLVGAAVLPCGLTMGALWVHVIDDAVVDLSGIPVTVSGQAGKPTEPSGMARWDPLGPHGYTVALENLTPDLAKIYDPPAAMSEDVTVVSGEITYVQFVLTRRGKLKVIVKEEAPGTKLFENATVTIECNGVQDSKPTDVNGLADFETRSPGSYKVTAVLAAADAKKYKCSLPQPVRQLAPNGDETVTILVPQPLYRLKLKLGEIDALFTPVTGAAKPWTDPGVRERLQALGYLYTPLDHPSIATAGAGPSTVEGHAHACWDYYKEVHNLVDDVAAVTRLKDEAAGNVIAASFPTSGQVFAESQLPADGAFAAIRIPGGYATTKSPVTGLNAGDHYCNNSTASVVPANYQFQIGYRRNEIEDRVREKNASLGKIPLIAEVQAEWPDGSTSPAEDVPVLFQLIAPDDPVGTAFVAPPLPDKVMNYDTDGVWWQIDSFPIQNQFNGGLDESEWKGLWTLVHKAWDATNDDVLAKAQAQTWITTWTTGGYDVDVPWAAVQDWWDGIAVTPYPRLIQGPDLVISKLGKIFDKIPDLANPPAVMPSKMAVGLAPLEVAEWEAVWKLVLKAMANTVALVPAHPSPVDHAKQQCIAWLRTWGAVNSLSWPRVSAWWTAQADTPYPRVRAKTAQKNLLGRVDFLLQQRAAASTRLAEITGAQRKYVTDLYTGWAGRAAPTDPQKDNVWHERGGKLGHADGIKAVLGQPAAPIDGFHTKRADAKKDFGTLALATMPADTGRNPHASECKTNDKGFAGVLMDPSRCGGDRYKLRAYIDPDWLLRESNGPVHEPEAKCGTLVVWRNLRLYRYYQMPNPWAAGTAPSPWLSTILEKGKYPPGHHEFQMMGLNSPMIDLAVFPGLATEARVYQPLNPGDLLKINERGEQLMYRPLAVSPTPFTTQFAWGYCEWIADAPSKSVLGNQERLDAMEFARNALERWWSAQGYQDVHWDTLFGFPKVTPRVDATSPFLFNMRVFSHYNELIANDPALAGVYAPFDLVANDDKQKMTVGLQFFVEAMMEYLCGGGSLPGFTIVQIPRGDNTEARAGYMTGTSTITSGYGTGSRGFYISHTESVYHGVFRIYPNTGNALHEFGHVLGLAHQMPAGASLVDAHQRAVNDPWQKPTADQCVCVMSYSGCYGDLCGECLLSLRGCSQPQTDRQIKDMYGLP